MILAIDPSIRSCGYASIRLGGKVAASGAVTYTGKYRHKFVERVRACVDVLETYGEPTIIAVERATPQTRKGRYTDSWGPGLAAGIWIGVATERFGPIEVMEVKVSEWRKAMIGKTYGMGRDRIKQLAHRRAVLELADAGRTFGSCGDSVLDESEAVCLGVFVASVLTNS